MFIDDGEHLHFHFSTHTYLSVSMVRSVGFVTHPCVKCFFSPQTLSHCMSYPRCQNQSNPNTPDQQVRVGVHKSLHTESKLKLKFGVSTLFFLFQVGTIMNLFGPKGIEWPSVIIITRKKKHKYVVHEKWIFWEEFRTQNTCKNICVN